MLVLNILRDIIYDVIYYCVWSYDMGKIMCTIKSQLKLEKRKGGLEEIYPRIIEFPSQG